MYACGVMKISIINQSNIGEIQKVASKAWPEAFKDILSEDQIIYMMEMMYSNNALNEQINVMEHRYFIVHNNDIPVAYMSIEHNSSGTGKTKIHKAYILPEHQRMGIGKLLFERAFEEAKTRGDMAVYLNVNKYNERAIAFYNKMGFVLVKEEVIDIGNGFVMDDYVFEKNL